MRDAMRRLRWEIGQTTAEYALVLLAAAAIAFLLITWAQADEGGMKEFFNSIIRDIQSRFGGEGGS